MEKCRAKLHELIDKYGLNSQEVLDYSIKFNNKINKKYLIKGN